EEPHHTEMRRDLGLQHLERDLAVVLELAREVDGTHPAGADLALNHVAIGEHREEGLFLFHDAEPWAGRVAHTILHSGSYGALISIGITIVPQCSLSSAESASTIGK